MKKNTVMKPQFRSGLSLIEEKYCNEALVSIGMKPWFRSEWSVIEEKYCNEALVLIRMKASKHYLVE